MVAPNPEYVEYEIRLNARSAMSELQNLATATTTYEKRVQAVRMEIDKLSKSMGVSFGAVKKSFMEADKALSDTGEGSVLFGQKSEQMWQKVEEGSKKGSNGIVNFGHVANIVFGMIIHQGINLVINAFQSMFSMALKGLRELETATYNLVQAERTLSEQGIDITPQGLDQSIQKLQKLDPLLSKIQATEAVSRVSSLVAPAVGLNAQEIDQLTQAIAILAVKNKGLGKSFEEVESQVSNAFLSGKVSVGINQLGVKITDQIVKDEALRLGLVKTADEYDKLTGKMQANIKARAMLSVLTQATSKDVAHLPEFFKTADAQFTIFQARMQDFFTKIGTLAAPILIKLFSTLAEGFQKATEWMDKNRDSLSVFTGILAEAVPIFLKLATIALKFSVAFADAIAKAISGLQSLINKLPFLKRAIETISGRTTPDIGAASDTPTGSSLEFSAGNESGNKRAEMLKEQEDKLTEIFKDARDKRLDIDRDYNNKLQDLSLNYAQKLEDIARNTSQKVADAQRDYSDKIADINRDTEQKKQDAIEESHKKSIEEEQKYQDELKKLREKYLMDLEDALHERDARQILRLMRQYQIDKDNAKKQREVDQQKAQEELQQKLVDIEKERKLKLEQAKQDLADKLRDIKIAADRERAEARINYQRQLNDAAIAHRRALEEQRIFLQRKLRDLAEALAKEYNMTATSLKALSSLYSGFTATVSSIGSPIGNASAPSSVNAGTYTPVVNTGFSGSGMYGTGGLAEGGTFLATRPQTINVAENRPEVITATPLGRPGRDISKLFTNGSMGGGGGQIEVALTLSPDLEARVIKNTLDETANIVTRINRSKS